MKWVNMMMPEGVTVNKATQTGNFAELDLHNGITNGIAAAARHENMYTAAPRVLGMLHPSRAVGRPTSLNEIETTTAATPPNTMRPTAS